MNNEIDNDNTLCPICLEIDLDDEVVITRCKHKFCPPCYVKYINQNTTCPLCRRELVNNDISSVRNRNIREFTSEIALQIIHLDIINNPEYILEMEEAMGINNENKTNHAIVKDSIELLSKYGLSIASRCKAWFGEGVISN